MSTFSFVDIEEEEHQVGSTITQEEDVEEWQLIKSTEANPTREELHNERIKKVLDGTVQILGEMAPGVVLHKVCDAATYEVGKAAAVAIGVVVPPLAPLASGVGFILTFGQMMKGYEAASAAGFWAFARYSKSQ
jgi:hypothetical protein